MVNFIIAAASLFSWVVSKSQIGIVISNAFISFVGGSQALYLFVLVVVLLIVGCLMDNVAATLILAPILIPVGYNLFTAVSISGLNFKQIVKGALPFLLTEILLLFVFAYVPGIITWLPRLMGYGY